MDFRRPVSVAVVLIALATTVACGQDGPGSAERWRTPALSHVPVVDEDVRLPFSRYELSLPDSIRAQGGNVVLLQDCMKKRGFSVDFGGDYLRDPLHRQLWGGPVGTLPLAHAQRFGYQSAPNGRFKAGVGFYSPSLDNVGLGGGVTGTQRSDPEFQLAYDTPSITDAERSRLEAAGVPLPPKPRPGEQVPPGCVQEVERAIGVAVVPIDKIDTQVFRLAEAVPAVARAMQRWASCMQDRGHEFTSITDPYEQFDGAAVSPAQVATAVDDVGCSASSGSTNYLYASWADYQEQAIARDPELFEAHLKSQKRRAAGIQRELGRLK